MTSATISHTHFIHKNPFVWISEIFILWIWFHALVISTFMLDMLSFNYNFHFDFTSVSYIEVEKMHKLYAKRPIRVTNCNTLCAYVPMSRNYIRIASIITIKSIGICLLVVLMVVVVVGHTNGSEKTSEVSHYNIISAKCWHHLN